MNLKQATSKQLLSLNCNFTTKQEVIEYLADQLDKAGKLTSKAAFLEAGVAVGNRY